MEKIINFSGPVLKRRDRNATSTYIPDNSSNTNDEETLSPVYTKKSHFFGKPSKHQETTNLIHLSETTQINETINEGNQLDLEETETHTPKDLQDNFSNGATKNIHSKFRSSTQIYVSNQQPINAHTFQQEKSAIKGDEDGNPQDEDELDKSNSKDVTEVTKLDQNQEKNLAEKNMKFKKDHKTRFMTQINNVGVSSDNESKNIDRKFEKANSINNHPYRHLIFSPMVTESSFKKHLSMTYRGLVYSVKCLKGPSDKYIKTKQVSLFDSKNCRKKTLLLDLDETLIHSCNLKENPQHVLTAINELGEKVSLGINIRPFCMDFLKLMSDHFEIFIFTASSQNYANTIVNYIDPSGKYINGILTRVNCMETKNGFFIKDLRIIKNRELKNMIIVDNLAHSFGFQIENGVSILEWHNDEKDSELKYICDYLIEASVCEDVRIFNKERLKLREMADFKVEDLDL